MIKSFSPTPIPAPPGHAATIAEMRARLRSQSHGSTAHVARTIASEFLAIPAAIDFGIMLAIVL